MRTLATSNLQEARLRACELYLLSERLFAAARMPDTMLSDDRLIRLAQDFYAYVLEQENRVRLTNGSIAEEVRQKRHAYYLEIAKNSRESLAQNRMDDAAIVTEAMLRKQGLKPAELDKVEIAQARQAILRAGVDLADAVAARYQGDFSHEPADALLTTRTEQSRPTATSESRDPSNWDQKTSHAEADVEMAARPAAGPPLSQIFETFAENQVMSKAWERQTQSQSRASFRLFMDIAGDRPLAAYTRQDVGRFRETAQRLPSDYGKSAKYKGLKVSEMLAVHDAQPAGKREAVISQKTIKRHFSALSALWENAISKGEVKDNIFKGFRFTGGKKATEQRDMWEPEELAQLFTSPLWTGCQSLVHRSTPGSLVIRDEKFWLPLIAVFSGMRQEEICQLHIEDIKLQDGIWYFDINNAPPRKLKNDTAVRRIPIHSQLIAIGLLNIVNTYKKSGEKRLFPDLKPGGADGRLGHSYTKWFTLYRRNIKLYRKGLDFHSFRHSATTFLHTADVQRTLIDQLTGHTTQGETTRYTKRTNLPQLKEAIEKLKIGVDLSYLHK